MMFINILKTTTNGGQTVIGHCRRIDERSAEIDQEVSYGLRTTHASPVDAHSLSEGEYSDGNFFFKAKRRCESAAVLTKDARSMCFIENDHGTMALRYGDEIGKRAKVAVH